ncbi:hypothetical protein FDP41_012773 [Naegleria fowleri]|uniref:Uncharacterized protein n=1 Tax=Naegleria fowleri TaxID=5763 RepID=A0A6A5C682_NAEFO|nr:uncharacterized protein FDP41_012773 [Naegleria fowleri]KAF0980985.1 hypothetical protein FDP41_012773 [Naegleria fowleri]CAG4711905.1 unnamed protein product [Naegleria fowleri]
MSSSNKSTTYSDRSFSSSQNLISLFLSTFSLSELQSLFEYTKSEVNSLVKHVKENHSTILQKGLSHEHVRFVCVLLLTLLSVLCIVTPGILSLFLTLNFGSFIFSDGSDEASINYATQCQRVSQEFIRLIGVLTFPFIVLNFLSNRWNEKVRKDFSMVMMALTGGIALIMLLSLVVSGAISKISLLIGFALTSVLCYLNFKLL